MFVHMITLMIICMHTYIHAYMHAYIGFLAENWAETWNVTPLVFIVQGLFGLVGSCPLRCAPSVGKLQQRKAIRGAWAAQLGRH